MVESSTIVMRGMCQISEIGKVTLLGGRDGLVVSRSKKRKSILIKYNMAGDKDMTRFGFVAPVPFLRPVVSKKDTS